VAGEQRAGRDAEILLASAAAETGRAVRAATVVSFNNVRNKLSRGAFTAAYFLQCLEAIGIKELRL
jgi:hypothetical protein